MKSYRLLFCALLCALTLSACKSPAAVAPTPGPTATAASATLVPPVASGPIPAEAREPVLASPVGMDGVLVKGTGGQPWWNDTTFYEVFVRSFYDSDGDGIGDINGLISKLDYLNDGKADTTADLGITGIWLMPIMASPSYHGYDVTDYYTVNPQYGTNDDFKRLMAEAHKRGIRIIIDLVLNHTSSQHPWFIDSQNPSSPKRDWYVWSNSAQGSGWHKAASGGYYYGYFWDGMPDLNYKNPAVTEEMKTVIQFWLEEMGVDGYRLDAVKYLMEDGKQIEHTPATHEWLRDFYTFYKGTNPQAFTVGEVWDDSMIASKYVGDQLDVVFEFGAAKAMLQSAVSGQRDKAESAQKWAAKYYPPNQLATFLTNHDQNRVRSTLMDDSQARTAASLLFAFQGIPFIYYGEEIGMRGAKPDEDIRRPMQWTPAGGFTTGTPWRDYYEDLAERSVEAQEADPASILKHYRAWIHLRNDHEALRIGEWQPVTTEPRAVYASLRFTGQERILTVVNLDADPVDTYSLSLDAGPFTAGLQPVLLMGEADALYAPAVNAAGGFSGYQPVGTLAPRSTYVIQFVP